MDLLTTITSNADALEDALNGLVAIPKITARCTAPRYIEPALPGTLGTGMQEHRDGLD